MYLYYNKATDISLYTDLQMDYFGIDYVLKFEGYM